MSEVLTTRLRVIKSKEALRLLEFVNTLTYKVEIKGNPFYNSDDKKWYLWFIPDDLIETTGILEIDLD